MRVQDQGGSPVSLGRPLGRGGQAQVFAVDGQPDLAAKIYHQPTAALRDRLEQMVARPPQDPASASGHSTFAWPRSLLLDATSGSFVGYVMPRVRRVVPLSIVYHPGDRKRLLPAGFDERYLIRVCRNLCAAVAAVHRAGFVVGDLNDANILVHADARVTLIDCDSFQIGAYRCPVGRPEYTPPELQGVALATVDRTISHDAFGLAVLIFRMLQRGVHPYAGYGDPPEIGERIRAGLYYGKAAMRPPPYAPRLDEIHPPLRALFDQAFAPWHQAARPAASAWETALAAAEQALVCCGKHYYFDHLPACPHCGRHTAAARSGGRVRGVPHGQGPGAGGLAHPPASPLRSRRPRLARGVLAALAAGTVVLLLGAPLALRNVWAPAGSAAESQAPTEDLARLSALMDKRIPPAGQRLDRPADDASLWTAGTSVSYHSREITL